MSRSRKRSPFCGITSATSEKQDKRLYNRRYRRVVKNFLHIYADADVLPLLRQYSNPWCMDKDGMWRFDPVKYPERMRK